MKRGCFSILLLLFTSCSRSDFTQAEAEFVDSLNFIELIHELLVKTNSPQTLSEAEKKVPVFMDVFDRIRESKQPLTYQLERRLYERYLPRLKVAWNGIENELRRLQRNFDSPLLLKVEAWLDKMMGKE